MNIPNTSNESFYTILNINENASKEDIKKAYRTLSLKYHPDKNPNNPECIAKFQKISEAYETLGDEQKKQEYDHFRNYNNQPPIDLFQHLFGMNMMGGGININGINIHRMNSNPFDNGFFNMQKPTPIIKNIQIDLDKVFTGISIPVEIERWLIDNNNKVFENETIYVDIPKGMDENEIIIIRDKGNILNEHSKGDVKIIVKIINNTLFQRNGLDLIYEKSISLKESLCGFHFSIQHLNGKQYTFNNVVGNVISNGLKRAIPNLGFERGEYTGNLIIAFSVVFPEKLTEEQIAKLGEIL
jgi:DnaJ-class molecular chaperone